MAVKITGLDDLLLNLNKFVFDTDKAISEAIKVTAFKVHQNAVLDIKNPSIGTYVTRYTAGGQPYDHVASKEGDAPNTDTGRLINSLAVDYSTGDHVAFVYTNLEYGFFLETVHNRPFLEPALDSDKGNFSKRVTMALDKQIKQAGQ